MKYPGITSTPSFWSLRRIPAAVRLLTPAILIVAGAAAVRYPPGPYPASAPRSTPQEVALPDPAQAPLLAAYAAYGKLPFEPQVTPRVPEALLAAAGSRADEGSDDESPVTSDGAPDGNWTIVTVAAGDNLSLVFSRLKLSNTELHQIVSLGKETAPLKDLRPGQILRLRLHNNLVDEMILELDQLNSLRIARKGAAFVAESDSIEPRIKITGATTAITQSLFVDGQKAGLSDALIMRLTDIFGWDVDFALDLQPNDRFSVIYEEVYKDAHLVKQDRILAAEFINQGKRMRAVLYTDAAGHAAYYSGNGEAMHKAFLRTPVKFTRISSGFTLARYHPILNTMRAHRGVDYAAPIGTPVRATADGKIRNLGDGAGYGNLVELQHGDAYSTLYAHLSRFARGIKRGSSVNQGQIIGYVGQSGLATGPHLHYEFRVGGVHRDPLTVTLPKALPLERRYIADFRERAAPLLNQLDVLVAKRDSAKSTYVAQLDSVTFLPTNEGNAPN